MHLTEKFAANGINLRIRQKRNRPFRLVLVDCPIGRKPGSGRFDKAVCVGLSFCTDHFGKPPANAGIDMITALGEPSVK
ncbi:hypothetical protein EH31_11880 [Erythrobacter longus]|uniref:Uncharacterized protein n=1 Tax=Erythrobacter longus TaxID=1044 RepID=A0A074MAR0_ERYLO|nr:hypothetical protein EH31_11880 [Erythrobacter longus]